MEKCFLCGDEYDKANRENVIDILNEETGEKAPVSSISHHEMTFAMCPRCVRASTFGYLFDKRNFHAVVDIRYEDEKGLGEK